MWNEQNNCKIKDFKTPGGVSFKKFECMVGKFVRFCIAVQNFRIFAQELKRLFILAAYCDLKSQER